VTRYLATVWMSVAIPLTALAAASPALSCSADSNKARSGSAQERRDVRKMIEQSVLIVDGEVVRLSTREEPALVEVDQVLRGWSGNFIEVGGPSAGSDCTVALLRNGERLRFILSGGPTPYDLYRDSSNPRLVDRILKSDRRKLWPYVAGEDPQP
jgi:hypothetical protein